MSSTDVLFRPVNLFVAWADRAVAAAWFRHGVTAIIAINAIVIGLDTSATLSGRYGGLFESASQTFLAIFVIEALVKMAAKWPRVERYFRDGWNVFDFIVIVVSLLPNTGELATLARLARLFRVLRLVSALPGLRLIVSTLIRSVPGMFNVLALMSIVFYVYGVAGYHLFHDIDPTHWRTLGRSVLTLFEIITLEGWTEVMRAAMEHHPLAWLYFVSFVVGGTFVVANLFIAVVINNLDNAKAEQLRTLQAPVSQEELLRELRTTQETLRRLENRLTGYAPDAGPRQ